MDELVFEVTQEGDGGFVAECLTKSIFTQANDWEELRQNAKEAVAAYYFDEPEKRPRIRLHYNVVATRKSSHWPVDSLGH